MRRLRCPKAGIQAFSHTNSGPPQVGNMDGELRKVIRDSSLRVPTANGWLLRKMVRPTPIERGQEDGRNGLQSTTVKALYPSSLGMESSCAVRQMEVPTPTEPRHQLGSNSKSTTPHLAKAKELMGSEIASASITHHTKNGLLPNQMEHLTVTEK